MCPTNRCDNSSLLLRCGRHRVLQSSLLALQARATVSIYLELTAGVTLQGSPDGAPQQRPAGLGRHSGPLRQDAAPGPSSHHAVLHRQVILARCTANRAMITCLHQLPFATQCSFAGLDRVSQESLHTCLALPVVRESLEATPVTLSGRFQGNAKLEMPTAGLSWRSLQEWEEPLASRRRTAQTFQRYATLSAATYRLLEPDLSEQRRSEVSRSRLGLRETAGVHVSAVADTSWRSGMGSMFPRVTASPRTFLMLPG